MASYPSVSELVAKDASERVLLGVYRSYRSILSLLFYFLLALAIVIVLVEFLPDYNTYLRWLAIIPGVLFLNIFRTYYNDLVQFEREKITQYFGRLSLSYEVPSLKYIDIRAISVVQDVFGRILDYGNIKLGSAGADGYEMTLHGIRSPRELAKLIYDLRGHIVTTHVTSQYPMVDGAGGLGAAVGHGE